MFEIEKIKGIIFDYGATIDTNGVHWAEVIWQAYGNLQIPVAKEDFRNAYVHGERTLATNRLVNPKHNFWHVLRMKAQAQVDWLEANGHLAPSVACPAKIADWCYAYAQIATNTARPLLKKLSEKYPLILVTNFYGNINAVLEDFYLRDFFSIVVESAIAGVRKPNPEIFRTGVEKAGLTPGEVVVIGDSYDKDIAPAATIGCPTIWLKNTGWTAPQGDETADLTISRFEELEGIFFQVEN
ncbi:hypothetical protein FACS1894181_10630 [Bacteroidia bacterium]|nr:hypothetical protein FACS1894181_10630 [Bacteroidia bacterium]